MFKYPKLVLLHPINITYKLLLRRKWRCSLEDLKNRIGGELRNVWRIKEDITHINDWAGWTELDTCVCVCVWTHLVSQWLARTDEICSNTFNSTRYLRQACTVKTRNISFFPETSWNSQSSLSQSIFTSLPFSFSPQPLPSLRIEPGGMSWRDGWRELGMLLWITILIKQVWWGKVGFILAALGNKTYAGHRALRHKQLATASPWMIAGGSRPSD